MVGVPPASVERRPSLVTLPEPVRDQPDSETWHDLYTAFGNAVYWAQTLEHTLVNVLALERLVRKERLTGDEFDQFMVRQFKQTLGQLIGTLKASVDVKEGFADRLACALEVRNLLVHRYFRERVQDLTNDEGRRRLIEELPGESAVGALTRSSRDRRWKWLISHAFRRPERAGTDYRLGETRRSSNVLR